MDKQTLKMKLTEFKNITEELIEVVNNEEPESIEPLFQKRQIIMDTIDSSGYDGDDFRELAEEIKLLEINKRLEQAMYSKRDEMKNGIERLKRRKIADRSYNNSSNMIKNLFSKEV